MHRLAWPVIGLSLLLAAGACGGGEPATDCNDGIDNDDDTFIDGADPGCVTNDGLRESPDPARCSNLIDDDQDGLIDEADWGCDGPEDDDETDPEGECNDGQDNDEDDLIDLEDPGCENPVDERELELPPCSDEEDNDGDGLWDYPSDPGCASPEGESEEDPAVRPLCWDLEDNDGDALIDFPEDPGCSAAADGDEFNLVENACGSETVPTDISATGEAFATIDGPLSNELESAVCGGYGGEHAYTFSVTRPSAALLVTTDLPETTLDTVVYVRSECQQPASELGCNDDLPVTMMSEHGSEVVIEEIPIGTYYIIVDTFGPASQGTFKLRVQEMIGLHGPCGPGTLEACLPGLLCQSVHEGDPVTCERSRCQDEADNDGDGVVDYPLEPGCDSPIDNDEVDPSTSAACSNGEDDDGDGEVDYPADPDCTAASDPLEAEECAPGQIIKPLDLRDGAAGSTIAGTDLSTGTCGGNDAAEDVYSFTVPVPLGSISLSTDNAGTDFDTILYVREGVCASGTQIDCNNDAAGGTHGSTVTFAPVVGTTYYLFVDGGFLTAGDYELEVRGTIVPGSGCDPAAPHFSCTPGYSCRESSAGAADWACRPAGCADTVDNDGDGFIDYPNDPGCSSISDDAEDFPNPTTACSNGADDDDDGLIDFAGHDPGCTSAADDDESDVCVPGQPIASHPGGTVTGTTLDAPALISAPTGCVGGTATSPEDVWMYEIATVLDSITFDTAGSTFDTVLYVRSGDCAAAGPAEWCNNNVSISSNTSKVVLVDPTPGNYFVVVDGLFGASGNYNLSIQGVVARGGACVAGDANFVCAPENECLAGVCVATACSDGTDNDGDGAADYPADWGCVDREDGDEVGVGPEPQCADGVDNDGDGDIDFPDDAECTAAAGADESCHLLYAADGDGPTPGNLYTINLCGASPVITSVGSIGYSISGLTFTSDGILYGVEWANFLWPSELVTIDPTTGAATSVGNLRTAGGVTQTAVPDITAVGTQLYGISRSANHFMSIDRASAVVTLFAPFLPMYDEAGLTTDASGAVYATLNGSRGTLSRFSLTDGTTSHVVDLNGASFDDLSGLTWHDGQLYSILNDGSRVLVRINPATGDLTTVAILPIRVEGLASKTP